MMLKKLVNRAVRKMISLSPPVNRDIDKIATPIIQNLNKFNDDPRFNGRVVDREVQAKATE